MAIHPLYPILTATIAITVVAPGALANDIVVPIAALDEGIPAGTILDFGASKFAKLAADAAAGDASLDTEPIPLALIAGDSATYAPKTGHPLLSERWAGLSSDDERTAQHIQAELLLDLQAPVYTGDDAEELTYAIVRQINFQLAQGLTPSVVKSVSDSRMGKTENLRDRYVEPGAWAIVQRVTGVQAVRFAPAMGGV